jgi:hypothetical protein
MTAAGIIALVQGLAASIPRLIKVVQETIKAGRDPGDVKLSDFMSTDALSKVRDTNEDIDSYIRNG